MFYSLRRRRSTLVLQRLTLCLFTRKGKKVKEIGQCDMLGEGSFNSLGKFLTVSRRKKDSLLDRQK